MPPSARSAAAEAAAAPPDAPAEAPQNSLLGLPDELLHLVADALLHKHLPSVLRLSQACTALRGRLAAVRAAAEARRLRWVEELTDDYTISNKGRELTQVSSAKGWAAGPLLPTVGRVSFRVRIEESKDNDAGLIFVGVCTAANTDAWGLYPYTGHLWRNHRDADGTVLVWAHQRVPPANYPDGDMTRVMVDEAGQPDNLKGRATGAVIEVVVDHSDGSLAFGINGAPPQRVPDAWPPGYSPYAHEGEEGHVPPAKVPFKFPQGAPLRPWARINYAQGDRVAFVRGYRV